MSSRGGRLGLKLTNQSPLGLPVLANMIMSWFRFLFFDVLAVPTCKLNFNTVAHTCNIRCFNVFTIKIMIFLQILSKLGTFKQKILHLLCFIPFFCRKNFYLSSYTRMRTIQMSCADCAWTRIKKFLDRYLLLFAIVEREKIQLPPIMSNTQQ